MALHRFVPGPMCLYYVFQFSVFMGFLSVQTSESLIRVSFLGLFSFCCFVISNFNVTVFILSYFILFY